MFGSEEKFYIIFLRIIMDATLKIPIKRKQRQGHGKLGKIRAHGQRIKTFEKGDSSHLHSLCRQ